MNPEWSKYLKEMVRKKNFQPDPSISLQIVNGSEGISEFAEDWDDLFAHATDASIYLSRPWIGTFIQERRLRGTALFILAWCGTKLVALFPLTIRKCLNVKIAEPIGTDRPSYLGLLLDPNYPAVVECIAEAIQKRKIASLLCIEDLWSGDNATNALLTLLAKRDFSVRRVHRDPCPFIRLGCSYEEYMNNTKSAKSRQTLRRKERRLRERHVVNIEYYNASEVTPNIIHRIASIQQQSWMKRRGAAFMCLPFYHKLLLAMVHAGFVQVWLMTIDDSDAAFVFAFVAHRKLYYAWTAFKLEYVSSSSIGQILTNWTIRDACRNGILLYDFEHGEAEYKRFWSTDNHNVYRVVAGRGLMGRSLTIVYFVLWRLGRIKWLHSFYHWLRNILRSLKLHFPRK